MTAATANATRQEVAPTSAAKRGVATANVIPSTVCWKPSAAPLRPAPADSAAAVLVAGLDLGAAHRQRRPDRANRAEAVPLAFGHPQHVEVDLGFEDLLHAADVRVPVFLVHVRERARAVEARRRIDDLVAVHLAAAAVDGVLGTERKRELFELLRRVTHRDTLWVRFSMRRKS